MHSKLVRVARRHNGMSGSPATDPPAYGCLIVASRSNLILSNLAEIRHTVNDSRWEGLSALCPHAPDRTGRIGHYAVLSETLPSVV